MGWMVIIGAHHDAYFRTPGADDHASGVAVMMGLARTLPEEPGARGVHLVAFSTEEPPFFATSAKGSHH